MLPYDLSKVMIFDGGMGSELERLGLSAYYPEELGITNADAIQSIHKAYAKAGADFITTNTFGLNCIKYKGEYDISELSRAAVANARTAGKQVFFDIGPTGTLLRPMGRLSFDEAYEAFSEVVRLSCDSVDGYILETFSDILELKAAVLAVKENCNKPVFATMTFDGTCRTLTGTTPEIMVEVLEGLGVDALGINCSLGPKEMTDTVRRILAATHTPVIVQPNRGLPRIKNGRSIYELTADEFYNSISTFAHEGVALIGGCCGTTPDFIKKIASLKGKPVSLPDNPYATVLTSATRLVTVDGVRVCGERLNPTGKKRIKEAILSENYQVLVEEGLRQEEAGADILDVNVGLPKIDEPTVMRALCESLQECITLPLQIDSSNPKAIEAGVRYTSGVALINSVNGERASMEKIFPIAKKYGAVVLGLTLDENGVPKTAEERFEIAKRIIETATAYGIPKHKIMIDTLVLTASAEQALVKETLKALTMVRALGVKCALGVSNVSFGLPSRPLINRTFLSMAMQSGLNLPILNPLDPEMMGAVRAYRVLFGIDEGAKEFIDTYADAQNTPTGTIIAEATLKSAIIAGLKGQIVPLVQRELEAREPMDIVNNILITALNEVGDKYAAQKIFLPQLIATAEAAKLAFDKICECLPAMTSHKETVVLATVKGDVHDIGKNIIKTVLTSYGYSVIDLGKDVPKDKVVSACIEHKPLAVGLSALMTTTVASMEETIKALREANVNAKIFVGGAVVTAEIASEIGADYYTRDALELVKTVDSLI